MEIPLFICYANCCRSVLAYYLYRHLHADDPALSAGLFAGECINDRAEHLEALRRLGPTPLHRKSFSPVAQRMLFV